MLRPCLRESTCGNNVCLPSDMSVAAFAGDATGSHLGSANRTNITQGPILSKDCLATAAARYMQGPSGLSHTHISEWDVSRVSDMALIWHNQPSFNADLSKWDTSRATTLHSTFNGASNFTCDLSQWDTSRVVNMKGTFYQARAFNSDLSTWDVSRVTTMWDMFKFAALFNGDVSTWQTSQLTNMANMFDQVIPVRLRSYACVNSNR